MAKKKQIFAYEFRDKTKLMYFINILSWKFNINTSVIVKDPVFEKTSDNHPVYLITEEDSHQYTISDKVNKGVQVINEQTL